jgi:ABC-type transport system involved in multi-copper enzyme maturation permease subunit
MTRLLRSELRKISTTRLWWGVLAGLVVAWGGLSLLIGLVAGRSASGTAFPRLDDPATVRSIYTAGLSTAYLFSLAFGVIAMAGEYRQQTITATLLATPRRSRVVLAKLAAVSLVGLGYGVAGALAGVVVGAPVIALRGEATRLTEAGTLRSLAVAALAVALWAVVGLGVGTLIRNQIVALAASVGVAWLAEPLLALALNAAGLGAVARFLPGQATSAVVDAGAATSAGSGLTSELLPWWAGALVLVGYAAFAGTLGATITLRRDVS